MESPPLSCFQPVILVTLRFQILPGAFGLFRWISFMKMGMLVVILRQPSQGLWSYPSSSLPQFLYTSQHASLRPLGRQGFLGSCLLLPCQLPLIFFLCASCIRAHTKVSCSYLYYFCSCLPLAKSSLRAESMFCSSLLPSDHLAQCPVQSGCLITSC